MDKLKLVALLAVLFTFLIVMFFGLGMANFQNLFGLFLGGVIFFIVIIIFFFILVWKGLLK